MWRSLFFQAFFVFSPSSFLPLFFPSSLPSFSFFSSFFSLSHSLLRSSLSCFHPPIPSFFSCCLSLLVCLFVFLYSATITYFFISMYIFSFVPLYVFFLCLIAPFSLSLFPCLFSSFSPSLLFPSVWFLLILLFYLFLSQPYVIIQHVSQLVVSSFI